MHFLGYIWSSRLSVRHRKPKSPLALVCVCSSFRWLAKWLQMKDVKLKGNAESLCRAETPLVWCITILFGSAAEQEVTVLEMESSLFSLPEPTRACLQPASSTSRSAATFMAFPCSGQARSSARWWVWRRNRAKALHASKCCWWFNTWHPIIALSPSCLEVHFPLRQWDNIRRVPLLRCAWGLLA